MSQIDNLLALHEAYPAGYPADFLFTTDDLVDGILFVAGVLPGSISVIDNNNHLVLPNQSIAYEAGEYTGTNIDFSDWDIVGTWAIRYNRGLRGETGADATSVSQEDLIKYTILFG